MNTRRKAFMMLDVLAGLFLLGALATMLIVAMAGRSRSMQNLSRQHDAMEIARENLLNLRSGAQSPTTNPGAQISVHRTGKRIGDLEWVEVKVTHDGRNVSLVGLARASGGAQ